MKIRTLNRKKPVTLRRRTGRTRDFPHAVCVGRRSPVEFTCGIDDNRALVIEESLDERERRG